jgi:hypothetical protein
MNQLKKGMKRTKTRMTVSMMINVLKVFLVEVLHVRVLHEITVKMTECNHVVQFLVLSASQVGCQRIQKIQK